MQNWVYENKIIKYIYLFTGVLLFDLDKVAMLAGEKNPGGKFPYFAKFKFLIKKITHCQNL